MKGRKNKRNIFLYFILKCKGKNTPIKVTSEENMQDFSRHTFFRNHTNFTHGYLKNTENILYKNGNN